MGLEPIRRPVCKTSALTLSIPQVNSVLLLPRFDILFQDGMSLVPVSKGRTVGGT